MEGGGGRGMEGSKGGGGGSVTHACARGVGESWAVVGLQCERGMTHACATGGGMWGVGVGGRWGDECDTRMCKGGSVGNGGRWGGGECCTRVCKGGWGLWENWGLGWWESWEWDVGE